MTMYELYFWFFAAVAVLCGFGVLSSRHPITGAVNLIGVMLALAGIYALNGAIFLGIVQILVYAGAIMMLVVFVIMVLNVARDESTPRGGGWPALVGVLIAVLLAGGVITVLGRTELGVGEAAVTGTAEVIGEELFRMDGLGWFVLFEVVGMVLLAALTGAVLLAKRNLSSPEPVGHTDEGAADESQGQGGH